MEKDILDQAKQKKIPNFSLFNWTRQKIEVSPDMILYTN